MNEKVMTSTEVAEILRISEDQVLELAKSGELDAFSVLGSPRITERALTAFMARPFTGAVKQASRKATKGDKMSNITPNRNPSLVRQGRAWAIREIEKVVGPLVGVPGRQRQFTLGTKRVLVPVATTVTSSGGHYWFDFDEDLLHAGAETFVVPVLADREESLVLPVNPLRNSLQQLPSDKNGKVKFNIELASDSYFLTGAKDLRLDVSRYRNAFNILG